MKPKYTTPCFIRRNTLTLRSNLENLGYRLLFSARGGYGDGLRTDPLGFVHSDYVEDGIDCGENERLFLALAALREDSDFGQWFMDDSGRWEQPWSHLPSRYMQMNGHKATPQELIEHFKE